MNIKTVYLFHRASMAYAGKYDAQESPKEPGKFITPDDHTETPAPMFDRSTQTCTYQPAENDWLVQAIPVQEPIPEPVILPTLDEVKANQITNLSAAFETRIHNGFTSSALGEPHSYPAKEKDQQNLAAAVSESLLPHLNEDWKAPVWCIDGEGNWVFLDHTASQIQQVNVDANASRIAAMKRYQTLTAEINAIDVNATTTEAEAIEAVQSTPWA